MTPSTQRRFTKHRPAQGAKGLSKYTKAVVDGRTLFPSRVKSPKEVDRVLVSGVNNRKIGKTVTVGRWKGFPIYTLTLEERATCPNSCHHWRTCYGNGMQFARRHAHGADLIERLEVELATLATEHPAGFVVRLHVLGDFYSVEYVRAWARWVLAFPMMRVFGYTAWEADTEIGYWVRVIATGFWDRFAIRASRLDPRTHHREAITKHPDTLPGIDDHKMERGFICPAQRRDDKYCGNCGACWESDHNVVFLSHGR